jgi:hypothetical protein
MAFDVICEHWPVSSGEVQYTQRDPGAIAQRWRNSDKKNWCREGGSNPHEVALGGF